jgi:hypothetical protein
MARHNCVAALVRADRYVFGVAQRSDDINSMLAALQMI